MTFSATWATEICPRRPHKPTFTLAKRGPDSGTLMRSAFHQSKLAGPRPDPVPTDRPSCVSRAAFFCPGRSVLQFVVITGLARFKAALNSRQAYTDRPALAERQCHPMPFPV